MNTIQFPADEKYIPFKSLPELYHAEQCIYLLKL